MKTYRLYKITVSEHLVCFSWSSENPLCVYADVACDSAGHASDAPTPLHKEDLKALYQMVGEMLDLTKG